MTHLRPATRTASAVAPLALWLALLACGCALPPPRPRDEVTDTIRRRADNLRAFVADMHLRIRVDLDGKTERLPSLGGTLAFDTAGPAMYMRATKFMHEIFTLRARGKRFSLRVPDRKENYVGGPTAYDRLPHLVRPQEVGAIFAGPGTLGLSWRNTTMTVEGRYYRFDVLVLGTLYRRVLIDRRDLTVRAIERYDAAGRKILDVQLRDHQQLGGTALARRLTVTRPLAGLTIDLRLGGLELRDDVDLRLLNMATPPGWREIDLDAPNEVPPLPGL